MKKIYKIIYILVITIIIISIPCKVDAKDFWKKSEDFIKTGIEGKSESNIGSNSEIGKLFKMNDDVKSKFEEILDFIWSIGLLVIFISTIILGIKYMFTSPEEKSRIKQATTPYIIGVIIIFGAVTIWKFTINILSGSL